MRLAYRLSGCIALTNAKEDLFTRRLTTGYTTNDIFCNTSAITTCPSFYISSNSCQIKYFIKIIKKIECTCLLVESHLLNSILYPLSEDDVDSLCCHRWDRMWPRSPKSEVQTRLIHISEEEPKNSEVYP